MFRRPFHIGLTFLLFACSNSFEESPKPSEPKQGPEDAGGTEFCPDPESSRVHYRDQDPAECAALDLECGEGQNGFDNACGCGCIDKGDPLCPKLDDTNITWLSRDPSECPEVEPACPLGSIGFTNSCGCGCIER